MSEYMKVPEYAKIKGVHERTVYRWIENGDVNARNVDGVLHIEVDDNSNNDNDIVARLKSENSQLRKDIEYLQRRLEQAQLTYVRRTSGGSATIEHDYHATHQTT